ncbi:hypothetical protein [Allorhizocola rhizosphaerae]|uniref:hypothetical protein n=1 Tax=Allorhizocola rhizosphaerae TaxID=1872709 RepID=UPI0013C2CBAB|nr:hypothetical protein [Allorhizocola rhizosphaerae]
MVKVKRGDIVSVVTIDAVIEARPRYTVSAPVESVIRPSDGMNAGRQVSAGAALGSADGQELVAPEDSVIVQWLVPAGAKVKARIPVVVLQHNGFGALAKLPPAHAYRMYDGPTSAKLQIIGGPGPAECRPVEAEQPAIAPAPPNAGGVPLTILCLLTKDGKAIAGLSAIVALHTAQRRDVLVLPVEAVAGDQTRGSVAKVLDGKPVLTEVKLGISDGVMIEIVGGLAEGDAVLAFGPNLRVPVS